MLKNESLTHEGFTISLRRRGLEKEKKESSDTTRTSEKRENSAGQGISKIPKPARKCKGRKKNVPCRACWRGEEREEGAVRPGKKERGNPPKKTPTRDKHHPMVGPKTLGGEKSWLVRRFCHLKKRATNNNHRGKKEGRYVVINRKRGVVEADEGRRIEKVGVGGGERRNYVLRELGKKEP